MRKKNVTQFKLQIVRVVIFIFLLPNVSPCQGTYDSLLFQLDTARSPQIKVDILNKIGFSFLTTTPPDLAMAKNYLDQSLAIAKREKYLLGEAQVQNHLGYFYLLENRIDQSIQCYGNAVEIFEKCGKKEKAAVCYIQLSFLHNSRTKDYTASNFAARRVLENRAGLIDKRPDYNYIYLAYFYLGQNYQAIAQTDSSNFYLEKAVNFSDTFQVDWFYAYTSLVTNYVDQSNYGKAITLAQQIVSRAKTEAKTEAELWGWTRMGDIYENLSTFPSAEKAYGNARDIAFKAGWQKEVFLNEFFALKSKARSFPNQDLRPAMTAICDSIRLHYPDQIHYLLGHMGEMHVRHKDTAAALKCFDEGIRTSRYYNNDYNLSLYLQKKGDLLLNQQKAQEALKLLREAYTTAERSSNPTLLNAVRLPLSRAEYARGDLATANRYYNIAKNYQDSIDAIRMQAIESLTKQLGAAQLQSVKLESENKLLVAERAKRRKSQILLAVILSSLLLLLALMMERRRILWQANQLSQSLNLQLETLIENIRSQSEVLSEDIQKQITTRQREINELRQQLTQDITKLRPEEKLRLFKEIAAYQRTFFKNIRETATRKEEELRAFNYTISHDLKAPLSAAGNFVDLLEQQLELDPRQHLPAKNYIQHFRNLLGQMNQLIEGIATYAYVDHEKIRLNRFEPAPLLMNIIEQIRETTPSAGQTEIVITGSLPVLNADRFLMRQVFTNLLSNAFKFSAPVERPEIRIFGRQTDDFTEITIADNGVGIPPESQSRIFELFRTAHDRRVFQGTGAGLAIVKRIIERHGGKVWVESAGVDKGTAFILQLLNTQN